ncbi:helix-turn-helix transcriptional regulator [Bradyrhizobium genosp. P]|uniref:helix-turn-helix transcriptional regulator n=1 Tax=Bradyrhizobium genosp. P TaxID=83641 RepID=UPI003CE93723
MEASRPTDRSGDTDIAPAVLAIGRPSFGQVLIDTTRRIAGVGHCMVFAFADERSARCLLDIGNIPIGPDLGSAYSSHFHLADPNRDRIFRERTSASPITLPAFARRMYSARYAKIFFEDADIVDKFAAAIWVDRTCFYMNFYRTVEQGRFSPQQVERLSSIAPGLGAAVARHFQAQSPLDDHPFDKLELLFSTCDPLRRLTHREKEVCLRILSGFTSEAISVDLGISLQSTFTYRKRAYGKLGISAQNELFTIVLRLLASPHRLN